MNDINFLAAEHAKAIFSRGKSTDEEIFTLVKDVLTDESKDTLLLAAKDFALLQCHTFDTPPVDSGLYLKLLHGRCPSDQDLDDWGDDGPWIGPLKWFHCTYLRTFGLGFITGEEFLSVPDRKIPVPIYFYDDMIYYRGMYYGDWEIQTFP